MNDTPETDAETFKTMHGDDNYGWQWREGVPAELSRKLERERDGARARLKDIEDAMQAAENPHHDEVHCTCVPLLRGSLELARKERDEAREALANETQFHHRTHGELVKAQCVLMDARAALQRIADCDWVITLPDRMDGVRKIARDALEKAK